MSPIVTTSSRNREKKIRPSWLFSLVAIIAIALLIYSIKKTIFADNNVAPVENIPTAITARQGQLLKSTIDIRETTEKTNYVENIRANGTDEEIVTQMFNSVVGTHTKSKSPEEQGLQIVNMKEEAKVKKAFDSRTETIISGLANTKRGFMPPPQFQLPIQESLTDILNQDIVIYDDDDEHIVQVKENCAALKGQLKNYIAEGGTPENFLSWYHNELTKDYNTWKESQMYIVALMKEGAITEAEEYMVEANKALTAAGIRNVTIPDNLRKLAEKKLEERK